MKARPAVANLLWGASSVGAWWRQRAALRDPADVQRRLLLKYVRDNRETVFGRAHGFGSIRSVGQYQARVPVFTYDDLEPLVRRVARGEAGVLTRSPVRRLVPSSGSTAAAKLIPYTRGLQQELSRAVDAWIVDLYLHRPRLMGGPAYWSITPATASVRSSGFDAGPAGRRSAGAGATRAVPVGFEDDSKYLGGARQALVRAVLAVPPNVRLNADLESFRYATLLFLLRAREIRLISVWHPSFLSGLLDALSRHWHCLIEDLARRDTRRAAELQCFTPGDIAGIWPKLALVSCWGDGPAQAAATELAGRLPGVEVQRKGLIASEGIVTIPFRGLRPIAVRSHFFEFLDPNGHAWLAHQLDPGVDYSVVLTTAGGLYRYRLADRVTVDGWVGRTPSLTFLGKEDRVSDRFGEKLSDGFVARALESLFVNRATPRFAMLAPDETASGVSYTLFFESDAPAPSGLATALERELRQNPHYAWCVDLGQLRPARVVRVGPGADRAYVEFCVARGQRLGDVKPVSLHPGSGWADVLPC